VTFATDDFARVIHADAMLFVDGLRRVKTQRRKRLVQCCIDETFNAVNEGIRDKDEVLRRVMAVVEGKFKSLVLLWILSACVQWVVIRILDHIWKPSCSDAAN
jgi:hypothetical protein